MLRGLWVTKAMMTSSNGNIFSLLAHITGTGHWWITLTQASNVELWCLFDLHLNKRWSKQSRRHRVHDDVTVMIECCFGIISTRWTKFTVKFNTLRPRQNGRRFADDTFKCIFLNENVRISLKISLKFVPKGPINNNPALVQIIAWRRSGDKPLSEPVMVSLLTHICVTRPQWVNKYSVQYIP